MIHKNYYEIFEIHIMPRGIVALTLRITRAGGGAPIDALAIHIGTSEEIPDNVDFKRYKHIGFNHYITSVTKSFKIIHKRIDAIRDALNHTNLDIFINNKLVQPYKVGTRYMGKGMYVGVGVDNIKGIDAKYHNFHDGATGHYKEYFNETSNNSNTASS